MFVIDGHIAWVGGAGFEDHYYDSDWIDTYVRVEGDIVRQLQAVFCTSFYGYGGELPSELDEYFPQPEDPGDIRVMLLQNIPGGFVPGTQASREAIENADERLHILNPYFTDGGIIRRVADASERGADVRIVTGGDSNNVPGQLALRSQYGRLIDAGVEIYEVPGIVHSKVTVADDIFIIGSINYDAWALYRNLELSLMFEDADLADAAVAQLVQPVAESGELAEPLDGWRETIPADFWWLFRYFL
jgi:cardiolipin synthase